jgi:murein L,D-transpeptidase YcbB/YkuD
MRVITGLPDHPTPSFHDVMEYIVVNPYWKIPESIVKKEMLSKLIRDPYYFERRGKILKRSWDENSERVDPGTVNWAQYRAKNKHIPYYFMQVPGTSNALGKIKFLFPNGYSVYIHDTPTKKLFFKNERAFSHGCMRIQKPRELLKVLALYNDNIDVEAIMARLGTREKKTIVLKRKVPVDITYLTAYIDPYGNINFRKDIYKYDRYQLEHYAYNPSRKRKEEKPAVSPKVRDKKIAQKKKQKN